MNSQDHTQSSPETVEHADDTRIPALTIHWGSFGKYPYRWHCLQCGSGATAENFSELMDSADHHLFSDHRLGCPPEPAGTAGER